MQKISGKITSSKNIDVIIDFLLENKNTSFLVRDIKNLPEDIFKADLIAAILENEEPWKEQQKVNKGEQIEIMISVCEQTLKHFFTDNPPTFGEYDSPKDRNNLAKLLRRVSHGAKISDNRKKTNTLDAQISELKDKDKSNLRGGLSFDEGWEKTKDQELLLISMWHILIDISPEEIVSVKRHVWINAVNGNIESFEQ